MLEKILIKDALSFEKADLKFSRGLNVFTGVSGAGKSVLINAVLALFGLSQSDASLIEGDIKAKFSLDEFGILNENPNNFRVLKDKSTRYFINSQMISRQNLLTLTQNFVKFLGAKNTDEINSENLIFLLDFLISKSEPEFDKILADFRAEFKEFTEVKKELEKIENEENRIEELKEFAKFEIDKISQISPKAGEFDELMQIKKKLSKKDKINELWERAGQIFEFESSVTEALRISGLESSFFEDAMNELRAQKESLNLEELEGLDIEKILDRIEALSSLNRRYGSIEEALEILEKRKKELAHYEQISFEKAELEKKFEILQNEISNFLQKISEKRKKYARNLQNLINKYLKELYMDEISLEFSKCEISQNGNDEISVKMGATNFKNFSSGETNRLRLAFIATNIEITNKGAGILILDEIDSNLSGKESMSIADVLVKISKFYQIFAISHQPQLSSKADCHFLVRKIDGKSSVKILNENEKITELARMISGENITKEALEFAKKLLV